MFTIAKYSIIFNKFNISFISETRSLERLINIFPSIIDSRFDDRLQLLG